MKFSDITLDAPVTVRVKGENKRLTRVRLAAMPNGDESKVVVLNGRRGRPRHLSVDRISQITVLA